MTVKRSGTCPVCSQEITLTTALNIRRHSSEGPDEAGICPGSGQPPKLGGSYYVLDMEDLWDGRWQPIGSPISVDASSAEEALTRVAKPGLKPGVTYRIRVTDPDGRSFVTVPAITPAIPTAFAAATNGKD
jgi:hypothetical protein